ncbi:hypothetical protein [Streptomyces sp. NPDC058867]|uniref:hypothetical protein n=1 Tax=unclassified Streptomyces TaxID=2593676 RepID=UPI0036977333
MAVSRERKRLLFVSLAAIVVAPAVYLPLGRSLALSLAGPFTLGMLCLALQVAAVMYACARYCRACARIERGHGAGQDPEGWVSAG